MKAVVFVDVQNDFVKGGKLPYGYPVEENTSKIIQFAKECRAKGYALFATADTHKKETYLTKTLEGKNLPVEHCLEGTEGHKIVEGLVKDKDRNVIIPEGSIVDKPTFGSFELGYAIENYFSWIGEPLEEIILCGYDLGICVLANAVMLRAKYPDLRIVVRTDLCGCVNEQTFNAACEVLKLQQIELVEG